MEKLTVSYLVRPVPDISAGGPEMIQLVELIEKAGVNLGKYKIHCATSPTQSALESFFDGKFELWQTEQTKQNFKCDNVLSLIHLGLDQWLFAGVFAIKGVGPHPGNPKWFLYDTEEAKNLEHLVGRAIVTFNKNFRASYLRGDSFGDQLIITELRPQRMSVGDFPGYNGVLLSHRLLRTIIREQNPAWKSALKSVSGVYIIMDSATGMPYVGSASGGDGIWQRWSAYAVNGHGGNKELKALLTAKGAEYVQNYKYSILEVSDLNSSDEQISSRETHWKQVLCSREFGYNSN